MNQLVNTLNLIFPHTIAFALFFLLSCVGFLLLFWAKKTNIQLIRFLFYIPANKSRTKALQLGGLPLVFVITTAICWLYFQPYTLIMERPLLMLSLILFLGVLLIGYIDDRFELRPRYKLAGQICIALAYSFASSTILYPQHPLVVGCINFLLVIITLNGTNLLDGLDSMLFKIFFASLLYFFTFALFFSLTSTVVLVLALICIFLPFAFLNKAPARVYLGEIGAGSIAASTIILSNILFFNLEDKKQPIISASYAALPLLITGIELVVSFLRRLINKKSPFKGDKLHVHYLLQEHYKLHSKAITNYYFLFQFSLCLFGFLLIQMSGAIAGTVIIILLPLGIMMYFGRRHWVAKNLPANKLFTLFKTKVKSNVKIISGSVINDFQVFIIPENSNIASLPSENVNQEAS
jgi:UDP-GlcNAc:undecaprenyl-phosphate GlcNAc-1-phosphate transferase